MTTDTLIVQAPQ